MPVFRSFVPALRTRSAKSDQGNATLAAPFAPRSLQLHPRHLTGAPLRVPNTVREKNLRKIFVRRKMFRATIRHCLGFNILIHRGNRAHYNRRIPQYT